MQDRYNLLAVEDACEDEASIIEVLAAIKHDRLPNDLKLLNYYREVPISFGAVIDSIDRNVVEISVHQLQAAAMLHQMTTFIKSKNFHHDVLAKVLMVGRENNFVFLTKFAYVQIHADRRRYVRVKVTDSSDAVFQFNQMSLKGTLKDISIGGAAILAPENCEIEENVRGTVKLWLRGTKLEVPGKLLRVVDESDKKKYIVELETNSKGEEIISQFIYQTQSEIIRELKERHI